MRVDVFSGKLTTLQTNLLIVTCFKDIRPLKGLAAKVDWYYGGLLSQLMMENRFSGERGETMLLASGGKLLIPKIILLGLGLSATYRYSEFQSIPKTLHPIIKNLDIHEYTIEVEPPMTHVLDALQLVDAFLNGEEQSDNKEPLEVTFIVKKSDEARIQQQYMQNTSRIH